MPIVKTLILMRHGDAPSARTQSHLPLADEERELTPQGATDTALTASYLAEHYQIDFILCSEAKRNRQTFQVLRTKLTQTPVEYSRVIYKQNHLANLTNLVSSQDNKYETILLLGHNPSVLDLTLHYSPDVLDRWPDKMMAGFKTSQIVTLKFACNSWQETLTTQAIVIDIFVP